jgi:hypothetical protein
MKSDPAVRRGSDEDGPEFPATSGSVTEVARRRWNAAVILLALAGAGLVLLSTVKYGAGITSLSSAYLDVARSLASGKGFIFHTGEPLVLWPPLYSMLLAPIDFATGFDPSAFAHIVNAVLFASVICLCAYLFRTDITRSATYSLLGVCTVLFSVPLSGVYATAWSECFFIPLTLLYLVFAERYWRQRGLLSLALMTASAALACLTRYVGVSLVLAGAVTIMLTSGVNLRARLTRAFAFAGLSLLPLGFWCLRNQLLTGTLTGSRGYATVSVTVSIIDSVRGVLSWYALGLVSELVVLAWVVVLTIRILSSGIGPARLAGSLKAVFIGRFPALLFTAAYMIVLLMTSGATPLDRIDNRLLSPVYIPFTLLLLEFGARLFGASPRHAAATVRMAPSLFLALWLCFPLASVVRSTASRMRSGAGSYNSDIWRRSETVAFVKQMSGSDGRTPVYSDGADALWELARINAIEFPLRSQVKLGDLSGCWPTGSPSLLVRFNRCWLRGYFTVQELEEVADIEEVARFDDGSVYRASVRNTAAAAGR